MTTTWTGTRRAVLACVLAAGTSLLGCSHYPDPYSGQCPRIDLLEVSEITATTAHVTWETGRLSVVRIRLLPEGGRLERLVEDDERKNVHDVTLQDLLPDTLYRMEVHRDSLLGLCGEPEVREFQTRPLGSQPADEGTPVPDPTTPVSP